MHCKESARDKKEKKNKLEMLVYNRVFSRW